MLLFGEVYHWISKILHTEGLDDTLVGHLASIDIDKSARYILQFVCSTFRVLCRSVCPRWTTQLC